MPSWTDFSREPTPLAEAIGAAGGGPGRSAAPRRRLRSRGGAARDRLESTLEAASSVPAERRRLRVPLLVGGLLLLIIIGLLPFVRGRLPVVADGSAWAGSGGAWAPMLFVLTTAACVALGAPRLVFCFAGGMAFGAASGLALSLLGSLGGAYGLFLVTRRTGSGRSPRSVPDVLRPVLGEDVAPSFRTVLFLRQVPAPGLVLNVLLGLTRVRHRAFLLGTLIGYLPEAVVASLAGSGLVDATQAAALPRLCAVVGILFLGHWALRQVCSHVAGWQPAT